MNGTRSSSGDSPLPLPLADTPLSSIPFPDPSSSSKSTSSTSSGLIPPFTVDDAGFKFDNPTVLVEEDACPFAYFLPPRPGALTKSAKLEIEDPAPLEERK